jgi:rubredoxin
MLGIIMAQPEPEVIMCTECGKHPARYNEQSQYVLWAVNPETGETSDEPILDGNFDETHNDWLCPECAFSRGWSVISKLNPQPSTETVKP